MVLFIKFTSLNYYFMPEHVDTIDQLIERLAEAMKLIDENNDIDKFTKFTVLTTIEETILHINELSKRVAKTNQ
jgi:hypothetical protein